MIAVVLKMLIFSLFWGILWWFVITFHCSWVIISFHRRRIYARKCSATNSFQMDNNSQKVKGYGTHRAISQTFYSMLTDARDVKVGERLTLFWVDNRIRSYAEDFLVNLYPKSSVLGLTPSLFKIRGTYIKKLLTLECEEKLKFLYE